jgi:hypothetical protein
MARTYVSDALNAPLQLLAFLRNLPVYGLVTQLV